MGVSLTGRRREERSRNMLARALWLTVFCVPMFVCSICVASPLQCAPGALAAGGDLRVANVTLQQAVTWCEAAPSCGGFTTRASACTTNSSTDIHKVYFKTQ